MDWKLRPNGDVETYPVTGWQIAPAGGVMIALQLQCYSTEDQRTAQAPVPIQFGLSLVDAVKFADDLRETALRALGERPAGPVN